MYDVITIGSATRDVFVISRAFKFLRSDEFETGIGECVSFGSKIELDDLVVTSGGGATNSATTFARLGFNTGIITRLGSDGTGRDILEELAREHVDTSLITTVKNGRTGYSTILTAPNGERSILVDRGVSKTFKKSDLPFSRIQAQWIYLTSLGGDLSLVLAIVKHATKNGIKVAFNPGGAEVAQGLRAFDPILRHISLLSVNLEEAQRLTGLETRDVKKLAAPLLRSSLTLVITDGQNGAYAFANDQNLFLRTRKVAAISRTGAGDAFGSGVVAGLMKGWNIKEALKLGLLNAESVITYYGAKRGILKRIPSKNIRAKISVRILS
jgi:sugar/nucleoside kinase (ribokinase family)